MLESLAPIFGGQTIPVETINVMVDDLKSDYEPKFKSGLQQWLDAGAFNHDIPVKQRRRNLSIQDILILMAERFGPPADHAQ